MQTVPMTVWEQAGLVVLFVLAIIVIIRAINKLLNDQRTAQLDSQQALLKQQQDYISARDSEWRQFFVSINRNNADDICKVASSLEKVTEGIQAIMSMVEKHNTEMADAVSEMKERSASLESKTQSRRRPQS